MLIERLYSVLSTIIQKSSTYTLEISKYSKVWSRNKMLSRTFLINWVGLILLAWNLWAILFRWTLIIRILAERNVCRDMAVFFFLFVCLFVFVLFLFFRIFYDLWEIGSGQLPYQNKPVKRILAFYWYPSPQVSNIENKL